MRDLPEQINVVLSGRGLQREEIATAFTGVSRHYWFVIANEVTVRRSYFFNEGGKQSQPYDVLEHFPKYRSQTVISKRAERVSNLSFCSKKTARSLPIGRDDTTGTVIINRKML